jgi:hypothetical protein
MAQPSIVLTEAHLSRGLALLGEPAVGEAIDALLNAPKEGERADILRHMLPHLSALGASHALRKMAVLVVSTGEELFDAEGDPAKAKELDRRAALIPAAEILAKVADFFGDFSSSGLNIPGFSGLLKASETTENSQGDSRSAES